MLHYFVHFSICIFYTKYDIFLKHHRKETIMDILFGFFLQNYYSTTVFLLVRNGLLCVDNVRQKLEPCSSCLRTKRA